MGSAGDFCCISGFGYCSAKGDGGYVGYILHMACHSRVSRAAMIPVKKISPAVRSEAAPAVPKWRHASSF